MGLVVLLSLATLSANAQGTKDNDPSQKQVQRLTNLPHVYINTFTGNAITSKENYVLARMWYVYENDSVAFYDSLEIKGRGNSTWNMAKKPYKFKFQTKQKLLGKGYAKTKKWTLLANHADKTLIRNAVTSAMGDIMGLPFNPAAKFVDLTLNDSYVGNYQISDQVDVRPHRVDITEQDYPLTESSDITGGYLLEADGFADFHTGSYWDSETQSYLPPDGFYVSNYGNVPIRIHYPDADELDVTQTNYIRTFINDFAKLLYSSNFSDPEQGYRTMVDSTTLVNWYLCTEMSGNVDGFFSTYFYKEQQDNRLYWGPLWDYDIAYNNDNRTDRGGGSTSNTSQQLMKDYSYGNMKAWVQRMWQDPWFARLVNRRYGEALEADIEGALNATIDSLVTLLDESQQLNYQRWNISSRNLRERVLYSTYDEYISDLRSYINKHLPYLQTAFAALLPDAPGPDPEEEEKVEPEFPTDTLVYYTISNAGSGTVADAGVTDNKLYANTLDESANSQHWHVIPLSNGYFYIVNRATGYALNDPTAGEPTATTLTGTQLNVAEGDSLDTRQQWQLVSQGNERYNIINHFSQHGANLSGGSHNSGTPIISYTSDGRNASSTNRMWYFTYADDVEQPDDTTVGINDFNEMDYALAYDPQSGRLHFGADMLSELTFPVRIYDRSGHLLRTFRACDGTSLASFPRGLYIITWTVDGRQRTVKLMR